MTTKAQITRALKHAIGNEEEVKASDQAGCFHCLEIFDASEVEDWIEDDEKGTTAVCPHCDVESVIGDAAGMPLTEDFLDAIRQHHFN